MREVPLPRDHEGREIPMNTEVLYDINGKKVHITSFTYGFDVIGLWGQWKVFSFDIRGEKDGMLPADSLYLTPPDSWEKLEEDLDSCSASTRYTPCAYFNSSNYSCEKCHADPNKECIVQMAKHIALRIHNLRGEGK